MKLTPQIAAMYLGADCQYSDEDKSVMIAPLLTVNLQGYVKFVDPEFDEWIELKDVKPILRRLEDMTEEEAREFCKIETEPFRHPTVEICEIRRNEIWYVDGSRCQGDGYDEMADLYIYFNQLTAKQFTYLLSKHFDMFGLIASGEAIDQNTLQP